MAQLSALILVLHEYIRLAVAKENLHIPDESPVLCTDYIFVKLDPLIPAIFQVFDKKLRTPMNDSEKRYTQDTSKHVL